MNNNAGTTAVGKLEGKLYNLVVKLLSVTAYALVFHHFETGLENILGKRGISPGINVIVVFKMVVTEAWQLKSTFLKYINFWLFNPNFQL